MCIVGVGEGGLVREGGAYQKGAMDREMLSPAHVFGPSMIPRRTARACPTMGIPDSVKAARPLVGISVPFAGCTRGHSGSSTA